MVTRSAGSQNGDRMVTRPVPADWLGQRRRADHQAREKAAPLIETLIARLDELLPVPTGSAATGSDTAGSDTDDAGSVPAPAPVPPPSSVHVIDVGAGTGSNQAWLAPRLSVAQHWTLLDHDADLLEVAAEDPSAAGPGETTRVLGTIEDLPRLTRGEQVQLVTCSALLDLLSPSEAEVLADAIAGPAAGAHVSALLSLTVTGNVEIQPGHPSDAVITDAFDAHQRRDGLLGPDAAHTVAQLLRDRGAEVTLIATDWALDSTEAALIQRYLRDRAAVAVEHDPSLAGVAQDWLSARESQLSQGELRVSVGHLDLLSLPGTSTR
ncbi:class I SAM-dependent methyltransferase [Nesterenkonia sp. LB17]|uniref:class I SAM-dependent methyltransferase n=1 Tax=Nesterenkonia sp. LB17 TaxID=2901230 RepID=UPI001F4CCC6D|nr:class I SAM-dependent methyltransferase [Nesterenkonia sp. LB17]MCH8566510.1 class I SAM-dependent methyltransferase [Nesterenkonia sp. LB17]